MSEINITIPSVSVDGEAVLQVIQHVLAGAQPLHPEGFTPYQIHTYINRVGEQLGWKPIIPQMMYNYSTNGMIVKGSKKHNGHRYSLDEVAAYLARYIVRRINNS